MAPAKRSAAYADRATIALKQLNDVHLRTVSGRAHLHVLLGRDGHESTESDVSSWRIRVRCLHDAFGVHRNFGSILIAGGKGVLCFFRMS